VRGHHPRPRATPAFDHAELKQPVERLADGAPGEAVGRAELTLRRETVADGERAIRDAREQLLRHLLVPWLSGRLERGQPPTRHQAQSAGQRLADGGERKTCPDIRPDTLQGAPA
jgi:hypothetical protein